MIEEFRIAFKISWRWLEGIRKTCLYRKGKWDNFLLNYSHRRNYCSFLPNRDQALKTIVFGFRIFYSVWYCSWVRLFRVSKWLLVISQKTKYVTLYSNILLQKALLVTILIVTGKLKMPFISFCMYYAHFLCNGVFHYTCQFADKLPS